MLTAEVPAAVLDRDAVGRALARLVAVCDLLHEESSAFLGDWAAPKPIAPTALLERYAAEVAELEAPTDGRVRRGGAPKPRLASVRRLVAPIGARPLAAAGGAAGGGRRRRAHAPRRPGAWRDPAGAGGRGRGGHRRDHARRPAGQASGARRCRAPHPQRSAAHDRRRRVHRLGRPALGHRRPRPGHARQGHARRGSPADHRPRARRLRPGRLRPASGPAVRQDRHGPHQLRPARRRRPLGQPHPRRARLHQLLRLRPWRRSGDADASRSPRASRSRPVAATSRPASTTTAGRS